MVLDRSVTYAEIEKIAYAADTQLLRMVDVFDVYEGDKIEAGKKSYALSFILRDDEATLQDKQIDAVMQKLMKQFESKLGAVIRKA
jgi:phenylalanyl-tRNA synthetase beta chain